MLLGLGLPGGDHGSLALVLLGELEGGVAPDAEWVEGKEGGSDYGFKLGPDGNASIGFRF